MYNSVNFKLIAAIADMASNKSLIDSRKIFLINILFFVFFGLGILYPDDWWGTHYFAFLAPTWKYLLFFLRGSCLTLSLFSFPTVSAPSWARRHDKLVYSTVMVLSGVLMGILFYHFPIVQDNYGDSFGLQPYLSRQFENLSFDDFT